MVIGAIFPVPHEKIQRIFSGKNVFVKPTNMKKLKEGMKIIFYSSGTEKGYVGEAEIAKIKIYTDPQQILMNYSESLFLTQNEFLEYMDTQKRWNSEKIRPKPWMAFELKNIKRYPQEVTPDKPIVPSGCYLTKELYEKIITKVKSGN